MAHGGMLAGCDSGSSSAISIAAKLTYPARGPSTVATLRLLGAADELQKHIVSYPVAVLDVTTCRDLERYVIGAMSISFGTDRVRLATEPGRRKARPRGSSVKPEGTFRC